MRKAVQKREIEADDANEINGHDGLNFSALTELEPILAYPDEGTASLHTLADIYMSFQRMRIGIAHRKSQHGNLPALEKQEEEYGKALTTLLRKHPLWPWLSQFPGLGGVHVAAAIGRIRNPRRFLKANGGGARSLWHYFGYHVVDGKFPRRQKNVKCTWSPKCRQAAKQPGGIEEQIVRSGAARVEKYDKLGRLRNARAASPYRLLYEQKKAKLAVDRPTLTPWKIEKIARTVAAKAFLADLWRTWIMLLGEEGLNDQARGVYRVFCKAGAAKDIVSGRTGGAR